MKKFITTILLLMIQCAAICQPSDNQYIFEQIANQYSFAFGEVKTITTDKNNMLWLGCKNGLFYYNSENIKRYSHNNNDDNSLPSNVVTGLLSDSYGRLWISTTHGLCYYDPQNDNIQRLKFLQNSELNISHIKEYAEGKYLIISNGILYQFSCDNLAVVTEVELGIESSITTISCSIDEPIYLGCQGGKVYNVDARLEQASLIYQGETSSISSICENHQRLYIGYIDKGVDVITLRQSRIVCKYREDSQLDSNYQLPSNTVRVIERRLGGDVWIATAAGIVVVSPSQTTTIRSTSYNKLPRNSIFSMHVDKNNSIWLGSWAGFVSNYNDANYRFHQSIVPMLKDRDNYGMGNVHHFAPKDDSSIWVASEWNGLFSFDYTRNIYINQILLNLHIKTLEPDKKGNLWIGTIAQGLYKMDARSHNAIKIELPDPFNQQAIISALALDEQNNTLWIGSRGFGLLKYSINSGESEVFDSNVNHPIDMNYIWDIELIDDDIYVSHENGLLFIGSESNKLKEIDLGAKEHPGICVYSLCYNPMEHTLYLATDSKGVQQFNIETQEITHFEIDDDLAAIEIYNILIDNSKNLWISSSNGVYLYDMSSEQTKHFTKADNLNSLQLHPGSSLATSDNVVFFGSISGFNYIHAGSIRRNNIAPLSYISNIHINNDELSDDNCKYINADHLADISKLVLTHANNSISFNIVSDNMLKSQKMKLKYRLLGYQDRWATASSNEAVTFTKLPYRKYTFEFATCNNDNVWGKVNMVEIEVLAPIYLRWYALLVYAIAIIMLVVYIIKETTAKLKTRRDIEIEREINIVNSKNFDEKVKFFMNVSHELRTPLSLISAPIKMLEQEQMSSESKLHIQTIKRNTQRLLRLTNQILDFRLLEVGKLKAVRKPLDMNSLCQETYEYFEYYIKEKNIDFVFRAPVKPLYVNVDRGMLGKVLFNLVANSLKYTEEGASVELEVSLHNSGLDSSLKYDVLHGDEISGDSVVVSVEDSGCGIPQDDMLHIFDRFYFHKNEAYSSSGIGLHMCKEYMILNEGNIRVSSKEAEGTKFTIQLSAFSNDESRSVAQYQEPSIVKSFDSSSDAAVANVESKLSINRHKVTILIVDDNSEIRFYMKQMLGHIYNCITAKDGQKGFDMAKELKPDLIIMDMLMPNISGVQCVEMLRAESMTKHIPIIMLTGLIDDQSMVKAMNAGADGYLSKPINEVLLYAHIDRLLAKSQEVIPHSVVEQETKNINTTDNQGFTAQFEAVIRDNVQNPLLDVNLIAELMQMSRSTLQRNVKNEMDMGVAEYVRDFRLRNAVKFMSSGINNIDELSMCVGFNSSSYFCKAFKDKYGMSPKKYFDSLKAN